MIIKCLTLHNFGVYKGTNTFEFSGTRPIVLIGGLNGRGKTTFLEAVLLSLYGSNSFAFHQSSHSTYGNYLRSYVNEDDGTLSAYVELDFLMDANGKDRYTIRRDWSSKPKRIAEKVTVFHNGETNEFLAENWTMFIENVLPSALSTFFFFDGEKISELAVDDTDQQMKESIRAMLGLTVLDRLKNDINRVIGRSEKKSVNPKQLEEFENIRQKKNNLVEELNRIDALILQEHTKEAQLNEQIKEAKNDYLVQGGRVNEDHQRLLEQRGELKTRQDINNADLLSMADSELPLILVEDLLQSIRKTSILEQRAELNRTTFNRLSELYDSYAHERGIVSGDLSDFISYVSLELDNSEVQNQYGLSYATFYSLNNLLDEKLNNQRKEAAKLMANDKALSAKSSEIDSYLSIDINEYELQKSYKRINQIEDEILAAKVRVAELQQERSSINHELITVNADLKRKTEILISTMDLSDDANRIYKFSQTAIDIIDHYSVELQKRKTTELAKTITTCYKKLANKKNLIDRIEMNYETLELKYYGKNSTSVSKESLSAGEKQLVVIAILWALAVCSKKKLPVIIDTPLSRLDSMHRKSLVKTYFPNASEQTIILSTDSEIDHRYYEMMKADIGDEYTLNYNDETRCTSIIKGYFQEDTKA